MIEEIGAILGRIPGRDRFPGVDDVARRMAEVAARHPGLVRRRRVGKSRRGDPIDMLSIGAGAGDALVFAGPHPNEPAGFLTVPYLAELLCADEELRERLDRTWHLIGCVDPDGARLNEGWYAGPFTRRHYARRFYRPPIDEQVEWTFPGDPSAAARLPETRALREVIDTVRPDLMCSLHNAEFGGLHYFITHDRPELAEDLATLAGGTGFPLQLTSGDLEIPDVGRSGPGVFLWPPLAAVPQDLLAGERATTNASSLHYAARYGTFSMIVEVPLWTDPRSADGTDSGRRRAEVLTGTADMLGDLAERVGELTAGAIRAPGVRALPFATSLEHILQVSRGLAGELREQASRDTGTRATVAEEFTARQVAHTLRLRTCGTALRLLDAERADAPARSTLEELFTAWADEAEAEAPGTRAPLSRLLAAQLGAILAAAAYG